MAKELNTGFEEIFMLETIKTIKSMATVFYTIKMGTSTMVNGLTERSKEKGKELVQKVPI